MTPVIVKVLPECEENWRAARCPPLMTSRIVRDISNLPTLGECTVPLFSEPGLMPNAGFYLRRYPWLNTEGYSLHLYMSRFFPVYLWNFLQTDGRGPFKIEPEIRSLLLEKGLEVYRELTTESADD